jgi:signal peptidase I
MESGNNNWVLRLIIGRYPKRTLVRIVVLVVTSFVVFKFALLPIRIEGVSMFPTYVDRHVNFVNRLSYTFHKPQRYDVVALRTTGISNMYMKRLIGMPGESVSFHEGRACINGEPLPEPYLKLPSDWEIPAFKLGSDEYFFVGDNRSMGWEEHTKVRCPRSRIVGRVLW